MAPAERARERPSAAEKSVGSSPEVELPKPLLVQSEGSPRAAALKPGGARRARAQAVVGSGEVRDDLAPTALQWPRDFDFAGVVPDRSKSFVF